MTYHLTAKSGNAKTGPIPVSMTAKDSCPPSCAFYTKGCYAKIGPLSWQWQKVSDGRNKNATDLKEFTAKIRALPANQLWRHNQAGDLPGKGEKINTQELRAIVKANKGRRGFTYTHKRPVGANARAIKKANDDGFTVNLSANNLAQADEYKALDIAPVVVVVPENTAPVSYTPAGNRVVICPAQQFDSDFGPQRKKTSCETCGLCQVQKRAIVGFRAHGIQKKTVEKVVSWQNG